MIFSDFPIVSDSFLKEKQLAQAKKQEDPQSDVVLNASDFVCCEEPTINGTDTNQAGWQLLHADL